jgi:hypothetical protein
VSPLTRITGRDQMNCEPFEIAAAHRMEANRQHLHQIDPDAVRILTTNIVDAHQSWTVNAAFTAENSAYAAAKHEQDRMDLYRRLFEGTQ